MSIEKVQRKGGHVWRVRWREGGRSRSKVLGRKRDAEAYDAEIRRRKRTGDLFTMEAGQETLAEFAETWWHLHASPNLARATLEIYAGLWDRHVLPRLGGVPLRELTSEAIAYFRADLTRAGVGDASVRKTLTLLQGILERAVEWRRIATNPARSVRKPLQRRARPVRPLSPATIERIRLHLLQRGRLRDATLVSVLAYAGLRPGEALALIWGHVRDRTILVERALSRGELKSTKTGRTRSVRLLAPLAADLAEWRLASGRPDESALMFPAHDGECWADHDWRNWRRRVFEPAARAAGVDHSRPYDLRHSFCSLLLTEGSTVVEVARQAGHSPAMTLATYAHVIEELEGGERTSIEAEIRRARDEQVSVSCRPSHVRSQN